MEQLHYALSSYRPMISRPDAGILGAGSETTGVETEILLDMALKVAGDDAPQVDDEALLNPRESVHVSDEELGELHNLVDHVDNESWARSEDSEQAPVRLEPEMTQKLRDLVDDTIRQRARGSDAERAPITERNLADIDAMHLLADGVVPSMMEGLLNQVHRNKDKNNKEAARLLLTILKAHGAYVYEHCTRLVDLALALAEEMGEKSEKVGRQVEDGMVYRDLGEVAFFLTKRSARQRDALAAYLSGDDLAQESLLHDLGKIQVPEHILYKPAPLNEEERRIMERHPVWGAEILGTIPALHHAIPVTRHHHERWDGCGYPDRKASTQIPVAARIVCVVDAFDAMVSDRPYRKALPFEEACENIRQGAGTQFDPRVAESFLRIAGKVWSPDRQY